MRALCGPLPIVYSGNRAKAIGDARKTARRGLVSCGARKSPPPGAFRRRGGAGSRGVSLRKRRIRTRQFRMCAFFIEHTRGFGRILRIGHGRGGIVAPCGSSEVSIPSWNPREPCGWGVSLPTPRFWRRCCAMGPTISMNFSAPLMPSGRDWKSMSGPFPTERGCWRDAGCACRSSCPRRWWIPNGK